MEGIKKKAMYCSCKRCRNKGIDLPKSMFITYNGQIGKTCQNCRDRNRGQSQRFRDGRTDRSHGGQVSQVSLKIKEILPIGDPPKFQAAWQERMYQEWLRDMKSQVIR